MAIFKYSIKPDALPTGHAGIPAGPFLVDASDKAIGWQLLLANFALALTNALRGAPAKAGRKAAPGRCVEVDGALDAQTLRQSREVLGVDIAQWHLNRAEITAEDGRYARMLWWPCRPQDQCPV